MVELNSWESDVVFDSESKIYKGKHIIDVEPISIVITTKFHPIEPEEPEEGESLFHS
jgi:hypothetical protein